MTSYLEFDAFTITRDFLLMANFYLFSEGDYLLDFPNCVSM